MERTERKPPRFAAALSTADQARAAADEVCRSLPLLPEGGGEPVDLAVLFVSTHHAEAIRDILEVVRATVNPKYLIGCTGESIAGVGREIERSPALALWTAWLPDVRLIPFHLEFERTADGGSFLGWPDELVESWPQETTLLVLGDPWTFPADSLLARLNDEHPQVRTIGGMASGGARPGANRLLLGDEVFDSGGVLLALSGAIEVRAIVSQGCRPIGRHFVVTKAIQNVIQELGGKPALEQLREVFAELTAEEKAMVRQGLHVGRVVDEYKSRFGRGDFLVRNVIGADTSTGAIAIGDLVRAGQTVQFHIRDAQTADEDLRELLQMSCRAGSAAGALLFTCNGRGRRLFPAAHHDAGMVHQHCGAIPLAGFFAQGEIGPIGGKSFLHGFTASLALFSAPGGAADGAA